MIKKSKLIYSIANFTFWAAVVISAIYLYSLFYAGALMFADPLGVKFLSIFHIKFCTILCLVLFIFYCLKESNDIFAEENFNFKKGLKLWLKIYLGALSAGFVIMFTIPAIFIIYVTYF